MNHDSLQTAPLTRAEKVRAARRQIERAGGYISKIEETNVGSLEQVNAQTQAMLEIREALLWIVDAIEVTL